MENDKLKQFLLPIVILFLTLACAIYLGMQIVGNLTSYKTMQDQLRTNKQTLAQKQSELEELKSNQQAGQADNPAGTEGKPFYKPVVEGMDTEAAIAGELEEIIQLVRANKIKVRSIKTSPDPADDNFVRGAGSQYNVARLHMEMIANYVNYDNFLKELYKHEHFLDIQSVEIVPYKKNKKILLIKFKLKVYAKK